jgi:hypothetical protein
MPAPYNVVSRTWPPDLAVFRATEVRLRRHSTTPGAVGTSVGGSRIQKRVVNGEVAHMTVNFEEPSGATAADEVEAVPLVPETGTFSAASVVPVNRRRGKGFWIATAIAVLLVAYASFASVRLRHESAAHADADARQHATAQRLEHARAELADRTVRLDRAEDRADTAEERRVTAEGQVDKYDTLLVTTFVDVFVEEWSGEVTTDQAKCFAEGILAAAGPEGLVTLGFTDGALEAFTPDEQVAIGRAALDCLPAEFLTDSTDASTV